MKLSDFKQQREMAKMYTLLFELQNGKLNKEQYLNGLSPIASPNDINNLKGCLCFILSRIPVDKVRLFSYELQQFYNENKGEF
jgi:hypothetical protein